MKCPRCDLEMRMIGTQREPGVGCSCGYTLFVGSQSLIEELVRLKD